MHNPLTGCFSGDVVPPFGGICEMMEVGVSPAGRRRIAAWLLPGC